METIFEQVESKFGVLDFFVSNASNGMLAPLKDITAEHWEKAFRTNVVGLHQTSLRAVELMKKRGGGKIITMSTPASHGYVDYFGCMGAARPRESLTKQASSSPPITLSTSLCSPGRSMRPSDKGLRANAHPQWKAPMLTRALRAREFPLRP